MPDLSLDHVVIGVPDLEEAATELSAALGLSPSWRGRHPSYGTANVLYRLDNAYLELLALDPEAAVSTPWTDALNQFIASRGGGLFAVALATSDVMATVAGATAHGLQVEEPRRGEGLNLMDGARREWINARVAADSTRGTRAFFIQHQSPAEALAPAGRRADKGVAQSVLALAIESADAEGARRLWRESFGLAETASEAGWSYDLANARLLLYAGVGEAEASDRWLKLMLATDSLTSLADRLDAERIEFEQGDFREGYGVQLACGGADVLFLESL